MAGLLGTEVTPLRVGPEFLVGQPDRPLDLVGVRVDAEPPGRLVVVSLTMLRWARWARAEVQAWPADLTQLDVTAEFARIVATTSRLPANPGSGSD